MSNNESALKLSAYTDSKLQFFYLKKVKGTMTAIKGLPRDASELMQNMIERIKPQHGRRYFEQVLIEEKDNLSPLSYNDFTEPAFLACSMNSLLIDASSEHEYTIASKGLAGGPRCAGLSTQQFIGYWGSSLQLIQGSLRPTHSLMHAHR